MNAVDAGAIQVHEIDLDAKHMVALAFPPGTKPERANQTIAAMRRLLADWWTNREPFLVVGLMDGLELRFHKRESEGED